MKDSDGNDLVVGAMYVCATTEYDAEREEEYLAFGELVRFAGEHCFLDADSLEETYPDFDILVRQACGIIDIA